MGNTANARRTVGAIMRFVVAGFVVVVATATPANAHGSAGQGGSNWRNEAHRSNDWPSGVSVRMTEQMTEAGFIEHRLLAVDLHGDSVLPPFAATQFHLATICQRHLRQAAQLR